ncbi:MAG: 3-phosphoglycerate dehydrogenase family protein [Phycisphaerales bacterium]|nr:3-phosphoglycerate dehydrogenase family protein [Phycisphaerales bacterium]
MMHGATTSARPDTTASTARATVLVADALAESGLDALRKAGCQVRMQPELRGPALADAVRAYDPDVLIVRSTKVEGEVFQVGNRLSLVIRAGAGVDTIDVAGASERGISVANCPGMNAIAVAELAWGLILACDRNIPAQDADLRSGVWAKKQWSASAGLAGKTLGIIGTGRIGQETAKRAAGFGMKVVAWSRSLTEDRADELGLGFCSSLPNLLKMSDVVSLHVAATADTRHLVDEAFCASLRPGAILVNTTRGSVIDEQSLARAIGEKGIKVGLDVWSDEPGSGDNSFSNALLDLPGVYGTHHVGASTQQAQDAVAQEAIRIVETWLRTGDAPNCVNRAQSTGASCLLSVRHLNQPGVLAHVFGALRSSGLNIEEMDNAIFEGGQAACARIQVDGRVPDHVLATVRDHDAVLSTAISDIPS